MLRKRMWLGLAGVSLIVALLSVFVAFTLARQTRLPASQTPLPSLIYGTNMSLYDMHDRMTNNPATQQLLRREHVQIIRMPSRLTLSDAYMLQALQAIKTIAAVPLVIVHGPTDPNAVADDSHVIALVQRVFGKSTVYVEFGNESDLAGVDVTGYTQAWNRVVPALKSLAPTYRFVGPVTWNANAAYIAGFDASAHPRPDANSWHEYACTPRDPDDYCMSRMAGWTTDVQEINAAVRGAIGTTLPLMLTEWNLDANPDPRYANANFIQTWTAQALHTLAANRSEGLIAAMQYCATNNPPLQLIDSTNHFTLEGQTFFQMSERAGNGSP